MKDVWREEAGEKGAGSETTIRGSAGQEAAFIQQRTVHDVERGGAHNRGWGIAGSEGRCKLLFQHTRYS